jgi:DNA repair protein RadC
VNPQRARRGIEGFPDLYAEIKGRSGSVREDGADSAPPCWHDEAVVRFFQRMGLVPRKWTPKRAALRICIAAGEAAQAHGGSLEEVYGVLHGFVSGEEGVCIETPRCALCSFRDRCRHAGRSPRMKDLPPGDRPRDRLAAQGAESLSDAELISLVIRDGTARESALELAQKVLARFGELRRVAEASVTELCTVPGIGPVKAAQMKATLEIGRRLGEERLTPGVRLQSSADVHNHFRERFRGLKKEVFTLVMLDQRHRVIRTEPISEGSLTQSVVHPREVFKPAISESAAAVIFVHNHPSGDPTPSGQDRDLTTRLVKAGELLGISVLDHVVIGSERFVSFREMGWIG